MGNFIPVQVEAIPFGFDLCHGGGLGPPAEEWPTPRRPGRGASVGRFEAAREHGYTKDIDMNQDTLVLESYWLIDWLFEGEFEGLRSSFASPRRDGEPSSPDLLWAGIETLLF